MKTWGKIISMITLNVIGVFFLATAAQAGTVDMVQAFVKDSEGNAVEGVAANLVSKTSGLSDQYGESNATGYLNFNEVTEGDYTIELRPAQGTCTGCALYENQDIDFTANLAETTDFFGYDLQSLDDITLTEATRFITVTVTEGSSSSLSAVGDPVSGIEVNAWDTTDASGQFQFGVDDSSTSTWNVGAFDSSSQYTQSYEYNISVNATGETEVDIEVIPFDASIVASLKNSDGSTFTLPTESFGSISCFDTATYELYSFTDMTGGSTQATVNVLGGYTYQCEAWIDGYSRRFS